MKNDRPTWARELSFIGLAIREHLQYQHRNRAKIAIRVRKICAPARKRLFKLKRTPSLDRATLRAPLSDRLTTHRAAPRCRSNQAKASACMARSNL